MRPLVLTVVLLALPAAAQQDKDGPAADPARPTVTNPAHIPPPGYLQFEQGIVQAISSPSLAHQFSIVQTTKLSLAHHLMVQVQSQPFAYTLLAPGQTSRDTGDLILGGQVLFNDRKEGHDHRPTVALAYNGRVRQGTSPDLDIGSFTQGLTLLASGTNFGFHYDTNVLFNQQDGSNAAGASIRRAQYGQTLSLSHDLPRQFGVSGELWHFTQPLITADRSGNAVPRSNAVGFLLAGSYNVRPNLVLDAGFERGLTSTSTAWQTFAGFTYLLPHRLWPGPKQ